MGVILKENNLIYTRMNHEKFLGSSQWRYDYGNNCLVKKVRDFEKVKADKKEVFVPTESLSEFEQTCINEFLRVRQIQINEIALNNSLIEKKPKKLVYQLNKKKVREKCSAFFGLKQSKKFLAFYSISFPKDLPDDIAMQVFNTFLTRCRKWFRLKSYLWVSERQKNGTIHFHLLTNNFMPIRRVNYFMAKAIETQVNKLDLNLNFDVRKYNGVDVRLCNNNKKRLNQYLTKYVSKNEIEFFRLPYHSSRDISQLFTAETFRSENSPEFSHIKEALKHINTFVVDNEYCSVEYLCQKQPNGKFFNPPESWYWLRDWFNEQIYNMYHSENQFDKIPLTLT